MVASVQCKSPQAVSNPCTQVLIAHLIGDSQTVGVVECCLLDVTLCPGYVAQRREYIAALPGIPQLSMKIEALAIVAYHRRIITLRSRNLPEQHSRHRHGIRLLQTLPKRQALFS